MSRTVSRLYIDAKDNDRVPFLEGWARFPELSWISSSDSALKCLRKIGLGNLLILVWSRSIAKVEPGC